MNDSFLAPIAVPVPSPPGAVLMLQRHPLWLTIFVVSGVGGTAALLVEFFGEGFPDFSGDAIILFAAVAAFGLGFVGLLLIPLMFIPNARVAALVAQSPGSDGWQAYLASSMMPLLKSRARSPWVTRRRSVFVLLSSGDLSVWQWRRGALWQALRVDRGSVVSCSATDVSYLFFVDAGISIVISDVASNESAQLELWPLLKGIASSGEIRSNEFNAEAAQLMVSRWIRQGPGAGTGLSR